MPSESARGHRAIVTQGAESGRAVPPEEFVHPVKMAFELQDLRLPRERPGDSDGAQRGLGAAVGEPGLLGTGDRLGDQVGQPSVVLRLPVADDPDLQGLPDRGGDGGDGVVAEEFAPLPVKKSMYSLPSTSQKRDPLPRDRYRGCFSSG